jgi:hypothetical protein
MLAKWTTPGVALDDLGDRSHLVLDRRRELVPLDFER